MAVVMAYTLTLKWGQGLETLEKNLLRRVRTFWKVVMLLRIFPGGWRSANFKGK